MLPEIIENETYKIVKSPDYNYVFNKITGEFQRWGKTYDDDPQYSPYSCELLDLEISVNGCPNACPFCYKRNTNAPAVNMTFETFKAIIDKFPRTLTQVAFGITGVKSNPDFFKMMAYCREIGVVPNFTLSGIDLDETDASQIAQLVGAVAVSAYQTDKNVCYNAVELLTSKGLKQVNIHLMTSHETLDFVYEVLQDRKNDPRLANMNAIVLLGVKPKGRAAGHYTPLTQEEFGKLFEFLLRHDIAFGFDSCSAPKFMKTVEGSSLPESVKRQLLQAAEPCESDLFSAYVNVKGEYWHCSFTEGEPGFEGLSVLEADDFLRDIWFSEPVKRFRDRSLAGGRRCQVFNLEGGER